MSTPLSVTNLFRIFKTIEIIWARKIGNKQEGMLPKETLFRVLIAHLATCKTRGRNMQSDLVSEGNYQNILALQKKIFKGFVINESEIKKYVEKIRQVAPKYPPYSWEWHYGRIVFQTTVPPEGHAINPNIMEAVGLLIRELSKYEYPKDLRRVLALKTQKRETFLSDEDDDRAETSSSFTNKRAFSTFII